MSQEQFSQPGLSDEQLFRLVDIVREEYGDEISKRNFAHRVLQLLEDISGFEFLTDSEANPIINKLWSLYHDQIK